VRKGTQSASTLLSPGSVGCPACVEERALQQRKRMRENPNLERNLALIAEHLNEEHALIYRLRSEGLRAKDIAADVGVSQDKGVCAVDACRSGAFKGR
jgi:FixJ family two-component response regulator